MKILGKPLRNTVKAKNKLRNKSKSEDEITTHKALKSSIFANSIRSKLIYAFLIPVYLIVLLGAISYWRASDAIVGNYKSSSINTLAKTSDYYQLIIETMESNLEQFVTDQIIKDYYAGSVDGSRRAKCCCKASGR